MSENQRQHVESEAPRPQLVGGTGLRCICATHYNEAGLPVIPKILVECPHHKGVHPARRLIDGSQLASEAADIIRDTGA